MVRLRGVHPLHNSSRRLVWSEARCSERETERKRERREREKVSRRSSPGAGPSAGVGESASIARLRHSLHCVPVEWVLWMWSARGWEKWKGSGRSTWRNRWSKWVRRSSALQGNIRRRGKGREFRLEVQIRVWRTVKKFESERAAERVWACVLLSICEPSGCLWWSSHWSWQPVFAE